MLVEGFPLIWRWRSLKNINVETHLLEPRPVVKNLKLQEDLGHLVVTSDHRSGFRRPQHGRVLLEKLHRLLNSVEELTGPQDLPSDGGLVAGQWGVAFLLRIQLWDHINVSPIVFKDTPIFVINTKIGYIQSVFFLRSERFELMGRYLAISFIESYVKIYAHGREWDIWHI